MLHRLKAPTGIINSNGIAPLDSQDKIVRPAILVHTGPNGSRIVFMSADGEIYFDDDRIKAIISKHNRKIMILATQYGGLEKMPIGAFPPVLDQHENDSTDRVIGRLTGTLSYDVRLIPGVGENVSCAVSEITFLGKENVEKVKDGRIYHLSIGIDDESDNILELSAVIEPAAPGAMLLKRGRETHKINGAKTMPKALKELRLKRMAKLSSLQTSLKTMVGGINNAKVKLDQAKKEGEITHRLTSLMKSGKLTPAETKKIDIKRLAALDSTSLETVMSSYEALEPKIIPGQIGSTESVDFASIGKSMAKSGLKRLKAEIKSDFKRMGKKNLAFGDDPEEDEDHGKTHQMSADETESSEKKMAGEESDNNLKAMYAKHMEHMRTMAKHLETGNVEEAKKHHETMMKHCEAIESSLTGSQLKHLEIGDVKSEDYKKANETMQTQIDELNTQVARIAGMVDELMEVEREEGEEFQEEADSHKKLESEVRSDVTPPKSEEEKKRLEEEKKKKEEEAAASKQ